MDDAGFDQKEAEHDAIELEKTESTSLTWSDVEGDRQKEIRQLFLTISDRTNRLLPEKPHWMDTTQWAIIHACARAQMSKDIGK